MTLYNNRSQQVQIWFEKKCAKNAGLEAITLKRKLYTCMTLTIQLNWFSIVLTMQRLWVQYPERTHTDKYV